MKPWYLPITLMLVLWVFLIGCAPSPMVLHPGFGNSVSFARQSQIYNSAAPKNLDPMIGLHGRSASKAVAQYEKAFNQKQKPTNQVGILVSPGGN